MRGHQRPQGPQGPQGPQEHQGPQLPQGPQGPKGPRGTTGFYLISASMVQRNKKTVFFLSFGHFLENDC